MSKPAYSSEVVKVVTVVVPTLLLLVITGLLFGLIELDYSQVRDLQRRVGQLEPTITPNRLGARLPEVGEIHWCDDCAAGIPCAKGSASPPNPDPSPKPRPSILWAIAGVSMLIIGLLVYPFLLNHTLDSDIKCNTKSLDSKYKV